MILSTLLALLVSYVWLSTLTVLAAPTAYQCPLPTVASGGLLNIPVPVALPTNGEFVIQFQRSAGEPTQASVNFSEIKDHKALLDRLAKSINSEAAQRPPKIAAVRESGFDQVILHRVALDRLYRRPASD
jgi:hypothetical protein